jgi:chaperonin GroES
LTFFSQLSLTAIGQPSYWACLNILSEWIFRNLTFMDNEEVSMATADLSVRPLHDRILVRRMEEDEKTAGGIIIPDTAKEKPQRGEVVAAGNGRVTEDGKVLPLEVQVGDKVLFGKYSGTELKLGSNEFLMMREDDVLGILN